MNTKRSFFERLTGSFPVEDEKTISIQHGEGESGASEEGELAVDVYQTPNEIVIKAMIAAVRPDDLDVSITRDMVTIKGKRSYDSEVSGEDYFYQELYWGSFTRTILLPQEIEPEETTATERHGLLTITLPKIDRKKIQKLRVRSS